MVSRILEGSVYAVTFGAVGLTFYDCFMSANCMLALITGS